MVIDKMVNPFIKNSIDTTIANCKDRIDFVVQAQGVGGPYAQHNPLHREYADQQHAPHKHLRAVRPNFGVNERGQLTDGGIKV